MIAKEVFMLRIGMTMLLCLVLFLPGCVDRPEPRPDADRLAEALGSTNPETRRQALLDLHALGQAALPAAMQALASPDPMARRMSVVVLANLPHPEFALNALTAALGDPDSPTRGLAAAALGQMGSPAANRLAGLLTDASRTKRTAAAFALVRMGADAVPALISQLDTESPEVRADAAWLLGRIGAPAMPAVPAMIRALEHQDARVVHVMAEAIDRIGPPPQLAVHHLLLLGQHEATLGNRLGGRAAPTLIRLLDRPGTPLALESARALTRAGKAAIPSLNAAMHVGKPATRMASALILSAIDPNLVRTIPEDLRQALADIHLPPLSEQ